MHDFTNILFDFGNVIMDMDFPSAQQRIFDLLETSDISVAKQETEPIVHQFETGSISTKTFLSGMQSICRNGVTTDEICEAWNSMLVGIPAYRLSMLEVLKDSFTLLMLSNTNTLHLDWMHDHMMKNHGVRNFEQRYFHDVYYSHLIKERKPNASAFRYVLSDAFVSAEKTLFIDDTKENIEAAQKLGFQTLLSPPQDEIAETLKLMGLY